MTAILGLLGPLGPSEVIIILVIVLILFGAKKLPELAKGLGQGIKEFKKATTEIDKEDEAPKIEESNEQVDDK